MCNVTPTKDCHNDASIPEFNKGINVFGEHFFVDYELIFHKFLEFLVKDTPAIFQ